MLPHCPCVLATSTACKHPHRHHRRLKGASPGRHHSDKSPNLMLSIPMRRSASWWPRRRGAAAMQSRWRMGRAGSRRCTPGQLPGGSRGRAITRPRSAPSWSLARPTAGAFVLPPGAHNGACNLLIELGAGTASPAHAGRSRLGELWQLIPERMQREVRLHVQIFFANIHSCAIQGIGVPAPASQRAQHARPHRGARQQGPRPVRQRSCHARLRVLT